MHMDLFNNKQQKNLAFTLSEVLITLGIIGVIAAITIPALLKNTQNMEFRNAFKKVYSEISAAFKSAQTDNGMDLYYTLTIGSCPNFVLETIVPYLSVQKFCSDGTTSAGNCWHSDLNWSNNNGEKLSMSDVNFGGNQSIFGKSLILNNGAMVLMWNPACGGGGAAYGGYSLALMLIDVNGEKGPNVVGRDIQNISIASNIDPAISKSHFTIIPGYTYMPNSLGCTTTDNASIKLRYGFNCAKSIISEINY